MVVVVAMFAVALSQGPIAFDFSNELYPQAEALASGRNPYPAAIWPPLAALVAMPFTILPPDTANLVFAVFGLACFAAALRVVGVRDWRVYGIAALWPSVIGEIRLSHLTPLLCLLIALAWRFRDRAIPAGLAVGLATGLKFFLWPLGVWLTSSHRVTAALVAAATAAVSLLPVLPLAGITEYLDTVVDVGETYDQDGYSIFGLTYRLGASEAVARGVALSAGVILLFLTWRRRSFAVAVAACLVLSPIVWLDYYALAAIPLAVARPSLSLAWFAPLATWGLPSSGIDTGEISGVGRVLVVYALVFVVAARHEPVERRAASAEEHGSSAAGATVEPRAPSS